MIERTLVVIVGTLADIKANARTVMAKTLADELSGEDTQRRITFESAQELWRVFTPDALELLRTIL